MRNHIMGQIFLDQNLNDISFFYILSNFMKLHNENPFVSQQGGAAIMFLVRYGIGWTKYIQTCRLVDAVH